MRSELLYRQLGVFVLFAAFFGQTFTNAFVIADYYTNTQAYAKHCDNKNKPQMHCNGKCQMMKKIQQEEKKDQQAPERKADNKNEVVLSSKSFFPTVPSVCQLKSSLPVSAILNGKSIDRSFDIFHPPQA